MIKQSSKEIHMATNPIRYRGVDKDILPEHLRKAKERLEIRFSSYEKSRKECSEKLKPMFHAPGSMSK